MKEETRYLWISELPPNVTQDSLIETFSTYGRVLSTKIHEVGNARGAVLSFLDTKAAAKACADTHKLEDLGLTSEYCDQHGEPGLQRLKDTSHLKNGDAEINRRICENGPPVNNNTLSLSSRCKTSRHDAQSRSLRGLKVWNFPDRSSDSSIRDGLFHEYKKIGKVISIVVKGEKDERSAVISFKRLDEADKAFEITKNGKSFFGMTLNVERHEAYPEDPDLQSGPDQGLDEFHTRATKTLFVGNLDSKVVSEADLREAFNRFGKILDIDIKVQNNNQGSNNSYAFVQFTDIRSVVSALDAGDSIRVCNLKVKLGFGKSQPMNCIWVANLADSVTESFLAKTFSSFGAVKSVLINFQRKRALIYFDTSDSGQAAVSDMKNRCIAGKKVQIDYASQPCQQNFVDELISSGQYSGSPICRKNYKVFEQLFESPDFHRQFMSRKALRYLEQQREMMLEYMKASVSHRSWRKFRDHQYEDGEQHPRRHDDFPPYSSSDPSTYTDEYRRMFDQILRRPKDRYSRESYSNYSGSKHNGSPTGSQKGSKTHSKDGDSQRKSHSPNHRNSNDSSTSSSPLRPSISSSDLRSILDRNNKAPSHSRRSSSKGSRRGNDQKLRNENLRRRNSSSDSNPSSDEELVVKGGATDMSLQKLEKEKQMLLAQLANLDGMSDSSSSGSDSGHRKASFLARHGNILRSNSERTRPRENSSPDKLRPAADSSGSTSSKPFSGDYCSPKEDFEGELDVSTEPVDNPGKFLKRNFRRPTKQSSDEEKGASHNSNHEQVDATIKFLRQVSELGQMGCTDSLYKEPLVAISPPSASSSIDTAVSAPSTPTVVTSSDLLRDPRLQKSPAASVKPAVSVSACTAHSSTPSTTQSVMTTTPTTTITSQQTQMVLNKLLRNLVASNNKSSHSHHHHAPPPPPSKPPPVEEPMDDADRELDERIRALDAKIPHATPKNTANVVDYSKYRIRKRNEPAALTPSSGSAASTTTSCVTTPSPIPDTSEFVKSMLFTKTSVFDLDAKRLEQSACSIASSCSSSVLDPLCVTVSSAMSSVACSAGLLPVMSSLHVPPPVSVPPSITPLPPLLLSPPSSSTVSSIAVCTQPQPTTPIRSILKASPLPLTLTPTSTSVTLPAPTTPAPSTPRLSLTSPTPKPSLLLNQNVAKRKHPDSNYSGFSLPSADSEVKKPKLHTKPPPERLPSLDDTLFKPDTTLIAQPSKKKPVDRSKSDTVKSETPKHNRPKQEAVEVPAKSAVKSESHERKKEQVSSNDGARKHNDGHKEEKKKTKHSHSHHDSSEGNAKKSTGDNPSSEKASSSSSKGDKDRSKNADNNPRESKAERLFDQVKTEKIDSEEKYKSHKESHEERKSKKDRVLSGDVLPKPASKPKLNVDDVFDSVSSSHKKTKLQKSPSSESDRHRPSSKKIKKERSLSSSSSDANSDKWKPAPVGSRGTPSSANTNNSWEMEFFGVQPYESMYDKIKRRQASRQSHESSRTPKSDEKQRKRSQGRKKSSKMSSSSGSDGENTSKRSLKLSKKMRLTSRSDDSDTDEEHAPQLVVHNKKLNKTYPDSCNEADDEEDLEFRKKSIKKRLEKPPRRMKSKMMKPNIQSTPNSSKQSKSKKSKMSVDSVYGPIHSDQSSDTDPGVVDSAFMSSRPMEDAQTPKTEPMTDESQVESISDFSASTTPKTTEMKRSCLKDIFDEAKAQLDPRSVTEKSLFNFSDDGFVPAPDLPAIEKIQPDMPMFGQLDNDNEEPPNLAVDPVEVVVGGNERETTAAEALTQLSSRSTAPLILGRISTVPAPTPLLRPLIPVPQASPSLVGVVQGKIAQPPVALTSESIPPVFTSSAPAFNLVPGVNVVNTARQIQAPASNKTELEQYVREVIRKVSKQETPAATHTQTTTVPSTEFKPVLPISLPKKIEPEFEPVALPEVSILPDNTASVSTLSSPRNTLQNKALDDIFADVLHSHSPKSMSIATEKTDVTPPVSTKIKPVRNPPRPMEASALAHVDEIIEEVANGNLDLEPYMDRDKYRKRYYSGDLQPSSTPQPTLPTPPVTVTPDVSLPAALQEIRLGPVVCTVAPAMPEQPHTQQQLVVTTATPVAVEGAATVYSQQLQAQQAQQVQLQAMYFQYLNSFGVPTTDISSYYNPYLLFQHQQPPPTQPAPPPTAPAQWGSQLEALLRKYPVKWQGKMALKNDEVSVQMHFVFGSEPLVKAAMDLASCGEPPLLKIVQRMRMEAVQLEGVQRKMADEPEFCMLLAVACGLNAMDYRRQTQALREAFIKYLQEKQAAGIVNVNFAAAGGQETPAYVVHIFPPGQFAAEKLKQYAGDLYANLFPQPHTETPHLLVVITTV